MSLRRLHGPSSRDFFHMITWKFFFKKKIQCQAIEKLKINYKVVAKGDPWVSSLAM